MTILRFILGFCISAIFLGLMLSVTLFWPQIMGRAEWASEGIFTQSVIALAFMALIIGLILGPFLGMFARVRQITSPAFYAFCWVVTVFGMIIVTPGLQSVEGQESGFWVPFYGIIFAIMAGLVFWQIAIRPILKEKTSIGAAN